MPSPFGPPTGESHAIVRYVQSGDIEKTIDADAYFERAYRGTIAVTVLPGGDSKGAVNVRP
ncbi:MAG: hypothetical protein IT175_07330 [Acidobacteria bacterium]|nr:hypothetical protein [Acidobacteriota bacterium]